MKKVLIHSIVFHPDGVSTAYLYNDIALGFVNNGFEVSVLTTTPHYNFNKPINKENGFQKKLFGLYYNSNYHGVEIFHIPQKKHKSSIKRVFGFLYWHIVTLFIGLFLIRYDYVLSPSPPPTIGVISIILGKIKKAKIVYNVQEIYPDLLINQKSVNSKLIIYILRKLERFVYNFSDAVVTIDNVFYNTIVSRFKRPNKLRIIPNFVDTDVYKPEKEYDGFLDKTNNIQKGIKVMYAGNIGHAQDWNTLIEVAKEMRDCPIIFFIIGEGAKKEELLKEIELNNLKNIKVFPYQKRELMSRINAFADIHIIFMETSVASQGFPSKVYSILACGKPIIVSSTLNSPLISFLNEINVGFLVTEENKTQKIEELKNSFSKYIDNPTLLKNHSDNARKAIVKKYSKTAVVQQYVKLLEEL
jgi:colanic acid biosynthesis glycosyl transferase WcaI